MADLVFPTYGGGGARTCVCVCACVYVCVYYIKTGLRSRIIRNSHNSCPIKNGKKILTNSSHTGKIHDWLTSR